jgi:DNA-binding Lrp family transcriptional regulator
VENLSIKELDEYCQKILTIFVLQTSKKEFGFNELSRIANKLFKISKPTLVYHLQHLIKLGIIKKRIEQASSLNLKPTFYSLNWEQVKQNIPEQFLTQTKELDKFSAFELVGILMENLYFGDLVLSKLLLEQTISSNANAQSKIWITRQFLLANQNLLLNKIRKKLPNLSKEQISNLLTEFDKEITKIMNETQNL